MSRALLDRRPLWILHVLVVGLALHNFVMSQLWAAGIRGRTLELISVWKEALLALGLLLVLRQRGLARPHPVLLDWLALAYGALVVVYGLIPQHLLGGDATHRGIVLGVREDLLPVACYFFGRGLQLTRVELRRLAGTILASAAAVAAFGLIDIYTIPLSWWRNSSGAPGWFEHQLGFSYVGLSHLPENFVYNTGGGHALRRLVSTFLSPLASSYMFVVALIVAAVWRLRDAAPLRFWLPLTLLLSAGLLWTHSRSSYLALGFGLLVLAAAVAPWRSRLLVAAVVSVVLGLVFVKVYAHLAPTAHFTASELAVQNREAHVKGAGAAVSGLSDASISSHWQSLRAGVEQVFEHPQGFGPGNAGSTAARTHVEIRAGESTYTQLGVDAGLVGGLLFVAWSLLLLGRLYRAAPGLAAAFAVTLALGLQTDIIGVPWLVYTVWTLAGTRAAPGAWQDGRDVAAS
jgi:hypothetical protein